MTRAQFEKFLNLASRLSPENLSCDGEISRAQVNAKFRKLTNEWKSLETEIGRKVDEGEIWVMARNFMETSNGTE